MRQLTIRATGPTLLCSAPGGEVTIEAAAADKGPGKFSMVAYTGVPMRLEGFYHPVVIDLDSVKPPRQNVPALRNHDAERIAGHTTSVEVSGQRIKAAGVLSGRPEHTDEVTHTARGGFPWQASVGATAERMEFVGKGESVKVNGRNWDGPLLVARGATVREISLVPLGADGNTSAAVSAALTGVTMNFDTWLKARGLDPAALGDAEKTALKAVFDHEQRNPPAPATPPVQAAATAAPAAPAPPDLRTEAGRVFRETMEASMAEERRLRAAEAARVGAIGRIAAQAGVTESEVEVTENGQAVRRRVDLVAHAIAQGWTAEQTELHVLRAARPGPGIAVRTHDRDCTLEALQGAMILRTGGRLDHPAYLTAQAVAVRLSPWLRAPVDDAERARRMEAAHRYSQLSAIDFCREACRLAGRDAPLDRSELIRAAFSGGTLTNIFTDSVNARLLATYQEAGDTTAGWTQETDVADFKQNKDIRLTKGAGLKKLPRGAEADHMTRDDAKEVYQVARYAGQIVVDEQDLIDDALNALADLPVEMGMAARRLRPDLVYAILLANPSLLTTARALFNATDGNDATTTALSSANLKARIAAMNKRTENSVNLNLQPTHLITPPSLRFTGRELINSSTILIAGTAGSVTERGSLNVLQSEGLMPVSDARLENGVTDPSTGTAYSGSATTWYLACALAKTIKVAYLRGTGRAPQVRSFVLDKGKWGMGWDINMDIGAAASDWRGLDRAAA